MEVPVCLEKRRVGTLRVEPSGADTVFRVCCTGLPAGLYRLYACGAGGELLLGITEDGCLHRRFSAAMTAPLGTVTRCCAQPVQGAAWRALAPSDGLPWPVPAGRALSADGAVLLRLRGAAGGETVRFLRLFRELDASYAGKNPKKLKKIARGTTTSCISVLYC